jgi:hypothetical protein
VLALAVVSEQLLAVAPRGEQILAHELGALFGGRNVKERLALGRPPNERFEQRSQGKARSGPVVARRGS